jgi:hypothetical protein
VRLSPSPINRQERLTLAIVDRISYAFLGLFFGALVGVACWWLYGLARSLNYDGPGMDPILRHWVTYLGGVFAAFGFLFKERVGDFIGDTISGILHFEVNDPPGSAASAWVGLVFLAIIIAAVWFTVPT